MTCKEPIAVHGAPQTTGVSLSNLTVTNSLVYGWVGTVNTRGTIDIAWSSLFTIFVCTFSVLCLNLPSEHESPWRVMRRRLFWMCVAISGPEFVLTAAAGQLDTATQSVAAFHSLGYPQWTIRHAFFADMGGFCLIPVDSEGKDSKGFPITGKHLFWLVKNGVIEYPDVSTKELWDKSKQATIGKLVACVQIFYLVVQSIARAIQRLAITTMELSALAIVVCSIMTSACWLYKPVDVSTSLKLRTNATIDEILALGGDAAMEEPWKETPLDFVDDLKPSWSLNVQTFMHMPVEPFERPIPRLGNDRLPHLRGKHKVALCAATLAYASIHLAGWNFVFPTQTEQILWRLSSGFIFGTTLVFWMVETTCSWHRAGLWQRIFNRVLRPARAAAAEEARRARRAEKVPRTKELPLVWEFWCIFPLAVMYGAARGYQIVEVFLGLRALQQSAFETVDWTQFIPHV